MSFFSKRNVVDKGFILEESFIYKNCICFNYSNIYDDEFIVQGFSIARDYCMISAYNKNKLNSRVYLYEKNGDFNKFIELDNCSHVGGISYDDMNDIVYITGNGGSINAYDYIELISGNIVKYECDVDISKVLDGVVSAATLYFYKNSLYVCTCSEVGRMVKYEIVVDKKKRKINVNDYVIVNDLPACIQGVCVYETDGELFYLFSQSYSRLKAIIKLYDLNYDFVGQKILDSIGLEGIDLDYTGNIIGVFENGINTMKKISLSELNRGIKGTLEKKYIEKGRVHQNKLNKMK